MKLPNNLAGTAISTRAANLVTRPWIRFFSDLALNLPPQKTSGTLAAIPTLGTADVGFIYTVTDYLRRLEWDGTAWGFAAGEMPVGFIGEFTSDPGTGWAACAGASVTVLQPAGTTTTITPASAAGKYLKK